MSSQMPHNNNPTTAYVLYGGAVVAFFGLTALLIGGFQNVLSSVQQDTSELDALLSGSSQTAVSVNKEDQFYALETNNRLVSFAKLDELNTYRVQFQYELVNTYPVDVSLNNAVVYLRQAGEYASLVEVQEFSSENLELNSEFDGVLENELFAESQVLPFGESYTIDFVVDLEYVPGDAPVRNILEVIGTRVEGSEPDSYPVSFPSSYPAGEPSIFNGSGVSLFFPEIELEIN